MSDKAQIFYKINASSTEVVRPKFARNIDAAKTYYFRYIDFVCRHLQTKPSRILDIGCGEGWSTLLFRQQGHDAHGMDLQEGELEAKAFDAQLPFMTGDARHIPLADASFDVVAMYQVLGHVPDPDAALQESIRVLRPGGRLYVIGPNLISFLVNGKWAIHHTLKCLKQGKLWESRTKDLPRHPGGNTMPEAWKFTFLFFLKTIRKLIGERPVNFWMREPDTTPPFFSNNDTCYFSNPMDLLNWAKLQPNVKAIRWWSSDRFLGRGTWFLRGGMWVVLEKTD